MREIRIFKDEDFISAPVIIIYDNRKDSDSEKALWTLDAFIDELEPGESLTIKCER